MALMSSSSSSDKSVSECTPQEFFERVKRILPHSALNLFSEEDFLKRYSPMARVKQITRQPFEDDPHIARHITQGSSPGSSQSLLSIVLPVALRAHPSKVILLSGVCLVNETPCNALCIKIPVGFPITLLLTENIPRALTTRLLILRSVLFTGSHRRALPSSLVL
ncbi:uncharacterized protein LOC133802129 [Humulus lupulus]|uniref:uncharacterized protein LOC133802129 n=1 Tax=Humulus lupulus TaxID=3486 RepID=UPI002B415A37|nr:uncharacterized protein LOC133802129 [Humulus lupulus]